MGQNTAANLKREETKAKFSGFKNNNFNNLRILRNNTF